MIGLSFSYYENPGSRTISGLDINSGSMSISFGRRKLKWPDDKFTIRWIFTKSVRKYSTYDITRLENSFPFIEYRLTVTVASTINDDNFIRFTSLVIY